MTIVFFAVFVLFVYGTLYAQPGRRFPQMRERVTNFRLNEIARRMSLEKERVEKLRPLYLKFDREKQALMDNRTVKEIQVSPDSLTDEQAERIFFLQMEKAKKMIEIREKYFREFREVLSPQEIMRFHRLEREVDRRMMQNIRQRFNRLKGR